MAKLPPLAAVRVFEAAARHENFSRAAEELAMTQAGVSYQMRLLEERLGVQLFARKGRGMELTAMGARIAPVISASFAEMEGAFASLRAENEAVLSIAAPQTFATQWLAPRLGNFQLLRPDIAVRLDVSDRFVDLAGGEFDVAIRGAREATPGLISHFLMRQPVVPMAAPRFLERHPIATLEDLLAAPRISPADVWWQLWLDVACDPASRLRPGAANRVVEAALSGAMPTAPTPTTNGIFFDSQVLDGQAALAGQGVAVLNPGMFTQAISSGLLVTVFQNCAYDQRVFRLCYGEQKRNLAKVRAFRDWMMAELRNGLGDDPCGALVPPEGEV